MNNLNNITRDWTHADQFLNDKIDKNNDSIKHDFSELTSEVNTRFTDVENEVKMLNGVAEDQFITDSEAKMIKVVPDGVNKGIVSMIGGKTVKMSQLVPDDAVWSATTCPEVTVTTSGDNVTITRTTSATHNIWAGLENIIMPLGHIWLSIVKYTGDGSANINAFVQFHGTYKFTDIKDNGLLVYRDEGTSLGDNRLYVGIKYDANHKTVTFNKNIQLFDLTAMFGAGKEPTAEQFMAMYGDKLFPYTPSDLLNTPVEKVVLTGRNLWDEKWEIGAINDTNGENYPDTDRIRSVNYINVEPNTKYYITRNESDSTGLAFYDSSKHFISYLVISGATKTFTTPTNTTKMRFFMSISYGKTYKNDIAIIKGENGVYEPYRKTALSLERIIDNLPDYGASAGDVYNYIDFENMVYHHKVGSFNREFVWRYDATYTNSFYAVNDFNGKNTLNLLTDKNLTPTVKTSNTWVDGNIFINDSYMYIKDSSTTSTSDFGNKIGKLTLVYELKTEELIDISDLLLPFKCEPGGTIKFVNEHNLDVPNTIIYEKEMK